MLQQCATCATICGGLESPLPPLWGAAWIQFRSSGKMQKGEDAQEDAKYMASLEVNCLAELWRIPRSKTRMFLKLEDDDSFAVRPLRENGP